MLLVFATVFVAMASCKRNVTPPSTTKTSTPTQQTAPTAAAVDSLKEDQGADLTIELDETQNLAGSNLSADEILKRLAQVAPQAMSFKPVGTSSVVFRVSFSDEIQAAFKPDTHKGGRSFEREIAAFRLSQQLAMSNVPPAIVHHYTKDDIHTHLHASYRDDWSEFDEEIRWDDASSVYGALVHWIADLRSSEMLSRSGLKKFDEWLKIDEQIPKDQEVAAADFSTMVAFDYLIGNFDRLSGGNLKVTADNTRLVLLDHNLAFSAPFRDRFHDKVRERLHRVQKFSRTLRQKLLLLSRAQLSELMQTEKLSEPLLSAAQVAGVIDRRDALVSYIQSLVDLNGEEKVLVFP